MLTKEVFVRGRSVYANGDVTLIRTSIGVYNMHVLFDASEWLDFPVKVVFGYGAEQVTQTLVLSALTSDEWAAEATVEIPWEVMAELGTVRVTFQGTNSTSGSEKHIITAMSGGLWSVAEEGDVTDGTVPTPAPTEDEWNQAFEAAMIAANDATSAATAANAAAVTANTQAVRAEAAAEAAEEVLEDGIPLMDANTRGGAKAGAGVEVDETEHLNLLPATASSIGGVTVDDSTIEATGGELSVKAVPADKLTGTISADNLPSYVDDVEEYASISDFPATGETGKIYVALDSNASYRWGGSAYVRVASGENATTATDGLMSHADKAKLDGIEAGANAYTLPTMSQSTKGGAKLGDGLSLSSDVLSLGPLTKSGQGASVETDGCAIFGITGEGRAEQDGTPTPESPVPIRVCRGRNLVFSTLESCTINDAGTITSGSNSYNTILAEVKAGETYTAKLADGTISSRHAFYSSLPVVGSQSYDSSYTSDPSTPGYFSFTAPITGYVAVRAGKTYGQSQINTGSTPMPYVPYGHVGLQVDPILSTYKTGYAVLENGTEEQNSNFNILSFPAMGAVKVEFTSNLNAHTVRFHAYKNGAWMRQITSINGNISTTFDLSIPSDADEVRVSMHYNDVLLLTGATTPVPLPEKGWAGAAGDFCDALSIDSAGKWEWDVETAEVLLDGTSTEGSATKSYNGGKDIRFGNITVRKPTPGTAPSIYAEIGIAITGAEVWNGTKEGFSVSDTGNLNAHFDAVSSHHDMNALLVLHPSTVLYPVAIPTTESGYIDLPSLPAGAIVSIPELESIGVSWFVQGAQAAVEHGNNVLRRAQAISEQIEDAVADLAEIVAGMGGLSKVIGEIAAGQSATLKFGGAHVSILIAHNAGNNAISGAWIVEPLNNGTTRVTTLVTGSNISVTAGSSGTVTLANTSSGTASVFTTCLTNPSAYPTMVINE